MFMTIKTTGKVQENIEKETIGNFPGTYGMQQSTMF